MPMLMLMADQILLMQVADAVVAADVVADAGC